nr:MAG TPA: hypothetical protein [Caudoviricetes sp.]
MLHFELPAGHLSSELRGIGNTAPKEVSGGLLRSIRRCSESSRKRARLVSVY